MFVLCVFTKYVYMSCKQLNLKKKQPYRVKSNGPSTEPCGTPY